MSTFTKSLFLFVALTFSYFFATSQVAQASNAIPDNVLQVGGAEIEVYFAEGVGQQNYRLTRPQILAWIEQSAKAVTQYFQRFPVKKLRISVNSGARSRIGGSAYPGEHPLVIINLRESFTTTTLNKDWVLVHELVHLSFPPVDRRHNWLLEGLATYVEPIVRVRAGILDEKDAWKWMLKGTPQGLPKAGNQGLDNTPTWGQTYWGGAIFFLLADMQIHQQTKNKYGIEHALRAIQRQGGSMQTEQTWSVTRALKIGDKATGTKVLETLYNKMKDQAVMTDLDSIWNDLGVSLDNNQITFDPNAKLVKLRQAIYQQ